MADDVKVMAPRAPTARPGGPGSGRLTSRLPDDLLAGQIQRLAVFSAVIAGLWAFGLAMDTVIVPGLLGFTAPRFAAVIESCGVAVSVAMYLYFGRAHHGCDTKAGVGLAFMIANAFGIALLNTLAMAGSLPDGPQVSWTAVLILVFSMISPAKPSQMLAASLVAASMDPLVTWIAYWRGLPALPPLTALLHYLPNYTCALVAMVPSRLFHRLGRQLREAQDLGSYQLVELRGRGGMGEVWRAQHRLL